MSNTKPSNTKPLIDIKECAADQVLAPEFRSEEAKAQLLRNAQEAIASGGASILGTLMAALSHDCLHCGIELFANAYYALHAPVPVGEVAEVVRAAQRAANLGHLVHNLGSFFGGVAMREQADEGQVALVGKLISAIMHYVGTARRERGLSGLTAAVEIIVEVAGEDEDAADAERQGGGALTAEEAATVDLRDIPTAGDA